MSKPMTGPTIERVAVTRKLADDILDGAVAAAEWTGFELTAIYHMVRTGQIPFSRRGTKLVFRKSELERRFSGQDHPDA